MDARSREQYSLQLAWLLAAIGGRIPEIDSFRDRLGLCECLLLLALITRPCNESDNEDDARSARKCPGQLPSLTCGAPAGAPAGGSCSWGTLPRDRSADLIDAIALRSPGKRLEEGLIRTWPGGSGFPGEYPSLMLLCNPGLKAVLHAGRPVPAQSHFGESPDRDSPWSTDSNSRKYARRTAV